METISKDIVKNMVRKIVDNTIDYVKYKPGNNTFKREISIYCQSCNGYTLKGFLTINYVAYLSPYSYYAPQELIVEIQDIYIYAPKLLKGTKPVPIDGQEQNKLFINLADELSKYKGDYED